MAGPFATTTDKDGIVYVVASGFWSPADLEGHFGALKAAVEVAQGRFGIARVLVDLRASSVQSQEVFDRLRDATSTIYGADDRIAIVAESALLTLQMRRLDAKAGRGVFANIDEARACLLAA